jgi:TctA family transporter
MTLAIPDAAGRVILAAALVPFLYFAGRDFRLHLTARRVSMAENLLHLVLGILLAAVITRAFLFRGREAAFAVLLFAAAGAMDEFVFHRSLPAEEHDVHAKEHFALFVFMAVFGALLHLRPAT